MKSKCVVWVAAILFSAAAGVLAQDNQNQQNQSATPPPAPQTSPVPEAPPVPPAPAEPGNPPPADNPAPPQASPALPQAAPSVAPSAPSSSAGTVPVDTIEKKASRRAEVSSRKSAKKSVEPAPAPQAESKDKDKEKAAAAGAASIDTKRKRKHARKLPALGGRRRRRRSRAARARGRAVTGNAIEQNRDPRARVGGRQLGPHRDRISRSDRRGGAGDRQRHSGRAHLDRRAGSDVSSQIAADPNAAHVNFRFSSNSSRRGTAPPFLLPARVDR